MLNKGFLFQLQLFLTSYICGTPAGPFYANQSVDVFVWFTPNVLTVGPLNATFTLEALNFLPANATPNVTVYGYLEPELRASQGLTPRCLKSVVNPRPGERGEMETQEMVLHGRSTCGGAAAGHGCVTSPVPPQTIR